jgi:predicted nuclease of predicted toxin-antitoxin system
MRFLANENFPGDAVTALRAAGHDIVWVRTAAPGSTDKDILAWAEREARVLLTFDKDFGELAWHVGLPASSGVVLFRLPMPAAAKVGAVLAARIGERTDWAGHFTVIEPGRIRMRPLAAQ